MFCSGVRPRAQILIAIQVWTGADGCLKVVLRGFFKIVLMLKLDKERKSTSAWQNCSDPSDWLGHLQADKQSVCLSC